MNAASSGYCHKKMQEKCVWCFIVLGILAVNGVAERGSVGGSTDGILYEKKHRPRREHDSKVVEEPGMIECREIVDEPGEKSVPFGREHESLETSTGMNLGRMTGHARRDLMDTCSQCRHRSIHLCNGARQSIGLRLPLYQKKISYKPRIVFADRISGRFICLKHIFIVGY